MSAIEDESQQLDAGWDDEEPSATDVDEAWDSVVPAPSGVGPVVAQSQVETAEVDGGWDDVPEPSGVAQAPSGKRRPHRARRAKNSATVASESPLLRPRPAENTKKQQREHARKQRMLEAQIKQQRKLERKAERAAEARAEAEERARQVEVAERARRAREEARELARRERPASQPQSVAKPAKTRVKPPAVAAKRTAAQTEARSVVPAKPRLSPGIIIVALALLLAAVLFLLRK